jgi:hypothetical protein
MENKPMNIAELVASDGWKAFTKKLELIGSVVFGAALVMYLAKIHGSGTFLTLGGSTLAVVYYFEAFKTFHSSSKLLSSVFFKIHGLGLSFSWIFVLFTLEHWPLPKTVFFFGSLIALLVSLLIGLRLNNQEEHPEITKLYFIRLMVALAMIVFVYLKYIQ